MTEGIWGGPAMIEDKADAVMFTIGLLRRLAAQHQPHSREWDYLLDSANTLEDLVGQQTVEGEGKMRKDEIQEMGKEAKDRVDATNKARIARVGMDLMNAYNRGRKDPSEMAVLGHDTTTGYEFYIERDGMVIKVDLTRDLGS